MKQMPSPRVLFATMAVVLLMAASLASPATAPGPPALRLSEVKGADPAPPPHVLDGVRVDERPWWERTAMDADRDGIFDQLDALVDASSRKPVDVLVDLDHTPTEAEAAALATSVGTLAWATYPTLNVVGLPGVLPSRLPELAEVPGVVMVEPRIDAVPCMNVATRALKARESDVYSPQTAWELGPKGRGVSIAIMDTGVDDAHPALAGKFVAGVDFTRLERPLFRPRDGTYNPDDTGGHGTTCAGISMGTGAPGDEYIGAAPEARLVDIRIGTIFGFSPGEGPNNAWDSALQAIDWAASHSDTVWSDGSQGIDVLSLSWGIPYDGPSDGSDAYSRGLDQCVLEGIAVCVAVGNEGPNNAGITGMSASSRGIIVGALNDNNTVVREDDELASYSSHGPRDDDNDGYDFDEFKPDVTAPGTLIDGVMYERVGDGSGGGYGNRGSGTSYAAPYVAGVSALLLEANPSLTPEVLREILRTTAERVGEPQFPGLDPYWNGEYGWGRVDAYNATKVAMELDNVATVDIELQAFVVAVTGGNRSNPEIHVEGLAWARLGEVAYVEYRLDGGPWRTADLSPQDMRAWTLRLDPAELGEGTHLIEARAVGVDGRNSVWRPVEIIVTQEAVEASGAGGGGSWGLCIAAVVVVAVAVLFVLRRRPDMMDDILRTLYIKRR